MNRRVAARSRFSVTRTSMTWPNWSIARVQIDPAPGDFDVRFVDAPPITRAVPAGSCRIDEQRREPLHPPIDGHVINRDAALGQRLLHITVGEPVTQIPANRNHDHIRWEAEPREAGSRCGHSTRATTHQPSLPDLALHRRNSPNHGPEIRVFGTYRPESSSVSMWRRDVRRPPRGPFENPTKGTPPSAHSSCCSAKTAAWKN